METVLTYECLTLAWFISSQFFLNYSIYLLPLGFYLPLLYILLFPSYSVAGCVAVWLCGWPLASSSPFPFLSSPSSLLSSIYFLCLETCLFLSPAQLLAVQLFIKPIRCFRQAK